MVICEKCNTQMKMTQGKVCTSIPVKYEYVCPHCGNVQYSTEHDSGIQVDNSVQRCTILAQENKDNLWTKADLEIMKLKLIEWDWEKYRRETAAKVLAAIAPCYYSPNGWIAKGAGLAAIEFVDELIKELKQKEEKDGKD